MIEIKKSGTADTRTCDWSKVTKEQLLKASEQHKEDVLKGMTFLSSRIMEAGVNHDWSKIKDTYLDMFFNDFKTGFKNTTWWEIHQEEERHHLKNPEFIQEDINLIDVLEMIVDGVMAGLARSGEYRKEEIPEGLLKKAFDNTIQLMLENTKIIDDIK